VQVAPDAAHSAALSRDYALTRGFGGDWSSGPGARAFPAQIVRPARPEDAAAATARFEAELRRTVTVVPLAIDPHRVLVRRGVLGVVPGSDGSLALEAIAIGTTPPTR
jgi:hypothetical protein